MRPVAAWLIARPQNAVIGLAATLLLPFAHVVSGTVMALVVLGHGAAAAAMQGALAMAILSASSLIIGAPVSQVFANGLVIWGPVMLLAVLMRRAGSLTLTVQVWVIAAMVVTIAFFAAVADPVAFWAEVLARLSDALRELGFERNADQLYAARQEYAPQMTMIAVVSVWSLYAVVMLFGYAVYAAVPGKSAEFGRFSDLNLGRVLAVIMAVASIGSMVTGAAWLQSLAFVSFAVFWLQGLALVHWLHVAGRLPLVALVLVYASMPLLGAFWILSLALGGYIDAWFGFRSRVRPRREPQE